MFEYNLTVIGKLDKLPIQKFMTKKTKLNIRLENSDKIYIFHKLKVQGTQSHFNSGLNWVNFSTSIYHIPSGLYVENSVLFIYNLNCTSVLCLPDKPMQGIE